jgi:hypothetical protein
MLQKNLKKISIRGLGVKKMGYIINNPNPNTLSSGSRHIGGVSFFVNARSLRNPNHQEPFFWYEEVFAKWGTSK